MAEYIPAQLEPNGVYDAYKRTGNTWETIQARRKFLPKQIKTVSQIGTQPESTNAQKLLEAARKRRAAELNRDTFGKGAKTATPDVTKIGISKEVEGSAKGGVIPEAKSTSATSKLTFDNLPCRAREAAGRAWNFLIKPLSDTPFGRILPTESPNACVQSAAKGIGRIPILLPIVAFATKLGNIYNGFKDGPVEGTKVTAKSAVEAAGITAGAMAGTVIGAAIIGRIPFLKNLATRAIPIMGREFSISAKGVGAFLAGAYLAVKGDWVGNRIGRAIFGKSNAEEKREMPRVNSFPLRPSIARDMDLYTPRIRRDLTYDEVHDFVMNPQQ